MSTERGQIGYDPGRVVKYTIPPDFDPSDLAAPLNSSLKVARECNLACRYCIADSIYKPECATSRGGDGMSLDQLDGITKQLAESGTHRVNLDGGEPLLRRDLGEIIQTTRSNGLHVALDSNGLLVPNMGDLNFLSDIDYFETTLSQMHGHKERNIQAMQLLNRYDINIVLSVLITQRTLEDAIQFFQRTMKDVSNIDLQSIKLRFLRAKGRGVKIKDEPSITRDEERQFCDQVTRMKEGGDIRCPVILPNAEYRGSKNGEVFIVKPNADLVTTPVPSEPAGEVNLGNLLDNPLSEVWANCPTDYKRAHISRYTGESITVLE